MAIASRRQEVSTLSITVITANQCNQGRNRPLLLMGHDLGGLLIKQALILAASSRNSLYTAIMQAVFAIVFFGTLTPAQPLLPWNLPNPNSLNSSLVLCRVDAGDKR